MVYYAVSMGKHCRTLHWIVTPSFFRALLEPKDTGVMIILNLRGYSVSDNSETSQKT
jgi:hypothetical protein